MTQPVFINDNNEYFYVADSLNCDKCNKLLNKVFAHCSLFGKGWSYKFNYCLDCYKESQQIGVIENHIPCILVNTIPKNCKPVVYESVGLVEGKYRDVFEAAEAKEPGCEVIDNTRYSGQSWKGVQIGNPDMEMLEEKDTPIDDPKEARRLLE